MINGRRHISHNYRLMLIFMYVFTLKIRVAKTYFIFIGTRSHVRALVTIYWMLRPIQHVYAENLKNDRDLL